MISAHERTESLYAQVGSKRMVSFELLTCLTAKSQSIVAGLCFETTEFSNGVVFLKDIWYTLVGGYGEGNRVLNQIRDYEREANLMFYTLMHSQTVNTDIHIVDTLQDGSAVDPIITPQLVIWANTGGIWIPTRALNQDTRSSISSY